LKTRESLVAAAVMTAALASAALAAEQQAFLRDRGPGTPTSMFGTYIEKGELLFYPFYEYYINKDEEYSPDELGFGLDEDFRGEYEGDEWLVFFGYGVTADLMVEVEAAYISAELETALEDPTDTPDKISESGVGDVQALFSWRWARETASRPMYFSFAEIVFPLQKDKVLIGTSDWEYKIGTGASKGFGFGTMTARAAVEYDRAENKAELGEVAIEYLRRISPTWRVYAGVEGAQDEIELIKEVQIHVSQRMFIKLNSAVGLTSKAADWAPETGVVFRF
jgi:hypothetical protein